MERHRQERERERESEGAKKVRKNRLKLYHSSLFEIESKETKKRVTL